MLCDSSYSYWVSDKYFIYGLVDPRDGQLRYVGQTSTGMTRVKAHGMPSRYTKYRTRCDIWIRTLHSLGLKYEAIVLEGVCDLGALDEAEVFWIAYLRFVGCNLLNHTDGGGGIRGLRHTDATKAKMAASNRGKKRTKETCENISIALRGKRRAPRPAEWRLTQSKRRGGRPFVDNKGHTFQTLGEAARHWNMNKGDVVRVLKGRASHYKQVKFTYVDAA